MTATLAGVCYLFGLKDDVVPFSISFRRRSVGKLMCIPSVRRSFSFLLFILLSISSAWRSATAQTLNNIEGAVSVFGQSTGTINSNGIRDHPTESMGGLLARVYVARHRPAQLGS